MSLRKALRAKLTWALSASMVATAVITAPLAGSALSEMIHGEPAVHLDIRTDHGSDDDSDSDTTNDVEWFVVEGDSLADMIEAGVIDADTTCKVSVPDGDTAHTVCDNGYEEWS